MKAWRLDTRSILCLPFWNQENTSSSQRWKTLAELFNNCSSLSAVPETPSWLDSWRNLWDLKPENEGGNLLFFDTAIDGGVEPQYCLISYRTGAWHYRIFLDFLKSPVLKWQMVRAKNSNESVLFLKKCWLIFPRRICLTLERKGCSISAMPWS